uniref:Uncharacterized protein n=1 Tax=Nelumbo nucifera TaxID=4432 RepID=A0A822ZVB4_NELNU|nr:TPA_asm: hypothetical protein HUJ06_016753 [Nelumbo nucifera]
MASLHIVRSGLPPFLSFRSDFDRKSNCFCLDSDFTAPEKKFFNLQSRRSSKVSFGRGFRVCCRLQDGENESNGKLS